MAARAPTTWGDRSYRESASEGGGDQNFKLVQGSLRSEIDTKAEYQASSDSSRSSHLSPYRAGSIEGREGGPKYRFRSRSLYSGSRGPHGADESPYAQPYFGSLQLFSSRNTASLLSCPHNLRPARLG